jgi:hypothetical protein
MTQAGIIRALLIYWAVVWIAVVFRIDRFPMTWAPMYSIYKPKPKTAKTRRVTHIQKGWLKSNGFLATQRNGRERWVKQSDLNVRSSSMRRIYYRRTRGQGPPTHHEHNFDAGTIDRWLWGLEPGDKFIDVDWRRRVFESINKTLDLEPDSPEFIVKLGMQSERYVFDRESLEQTDTQLEEFEIEWNEVWRDDF